MEAKRIEIAALLHAPHTVKESDISMLFNVSCLTVHGVARRLSEGENPKDRPRVGRPRDILTKAYSTIILFIHNRIDCENLFI